MNVVINSQQILVVWPVTIKLSTMNGRGGAGLAGQTTDTGKSKFQMHYNNVVDASFFIYLWILQVYLQPSLQVLILRLLACGCGC